MARAKHKDYPCSVVTINQIAHGMIDRLPMYAVRIKARHEFHDILYKWIMQSGGSTQVRIECCWDEWMEVWQEEYAGGGW